MASTTKVLRFDKTTWNQPIVCRLASEYGLTFNILKAFIVPRQEGRMVLEIIGDKENCKKGLQYLRRCGVRVEREGRQGLRSVWRLLGPVPHACPFHRAVFDAGRVRPFPVHRLWLVRKGLSQPGIETESE